MRVLAKLGNSWQEKLFITFQELREDAKIITNKARIIHIIDQEPQICSSCSFSDINKPPKKGFFGDCRFFQRVRFNKRMSLYKQANILTTILQVVDGTDQSDDKVFMRLATLRDLKECKRNEKSKHQEMIEIMKKYFDNQHHETMKKLDSKLQELVTILEKLDTKQ